MRKASSGWYGVLAAVCAACLGGWAQDDTAAQIEALKKRIETLEKEKAAAKPVASAAADKVVENKYGPNAVVKTKEGALKISGLVQVWYYNIQNDNFGFFGDVSPSRTGGDTNQGRDNDGFRIRRTELKFEMDIHENVGAVVMMDPAREVTGQPSFATNLGTNLRSVTKTVSESSSSSGRILQDAFLKFRGVIPHHDAQIGQFKPFIGEEGIRSSAQLDFVERSMIGQLGDARDLGVTVHGTWWEDRFQYWLGAFNGNGCFFAPAFQNKTDDNDELALIYRALVRPVWKDEKWGSLELGASSQFNKKGEAGRAPYTASTLTDGLNREETWTMRHYAWLSYAPGGPVKGWWLKGEFAWIKDRYDPPGGAVGVSAPNTWSSPDGSGLRSFTGATQTAPMPFHTYGWYAATGYHIGNSVFKDSLPKAFRPLEFVFRYETYGNIHVASLDHEGTRQNRETDVWFTDVYTVGFNYYIKGHNAKIQANYSISDEPNQEGRDVLFDGSRRRVREVRNNSLVVNFQVAW